MVSDIINKLKSRILNHDVIKYASSRNFKNGSVSKLSPYISRGVISTRFVLETLINRGIEIKKMEKFFQELTWRDYWQKKWQMSPEIDKDLNYKQHPVAHLNFPQNVFDANTKITAVDNAIKEFYNSGYLHNHMRMYIAAICCNIGQYHWLNPAKWMYYHLLDGDWGSNALSWQWVAGTTRQKKYIANQENINKYFFTEDKNTFMDKSYEKLYSFSTIPSSLNSQKKIELNTILPEQNKPIIDDSKPTFIYNSYNLDPLWYSNETGNRILLFEPSHFKSYPVSEKVIDFITTLSSQIEDIQLVVMEFEELYDNIKNCKSIHYKEHPFASHYKGIKTERDWIFPDLEADGSFFRYWNKGIKLFNYR